MDLAVLGLFNLFKFIGDMDLVVKVLAFSYLLFWLFITFRDSPLIFGAASVIAGYFMFTVPLPTTLIIIVFVVFVVMGNQFQMLIMFGLYPILRFFGVHPKDPMAPGQEDQMRMMELQEKMARGEMLSEQEENFLVEQQKRSVRVEAQMQNIQMRRMR